MGGETCVDLNDNHVVLTQYEKKNRKSEFSFDKIFGPDSTQMQVFEGVGKPILRRKHQYVPFSIKKVKKRPKV